MIFSKDLDSCPHEPSEKECYELVREDTRTKALSMQKKGSRLEAYFVSLRSKNYTYWFSITGITSMSMSSLLSFSAGTITPALLGADILSLI